MKIYPGCPPPKIAELLTRGANLPRGMDRAWIRVPLVSVEHVWELECPCALHGQPLLSSSSRDAPAIRTIHLARIDVVLACSDHEHDPESYWTGYCPSCCVVYWAHG